MKRDEPLPPLNTDDATTDAEKNVILRNAIDEAARNDPTRFTTRSFAVLENTGHSLRLINRDDPRKAISIPWDELSALRSVIDIVTQNTTTATPATPPETPVVASEAIRAAAEEIDRTIVSLGGFKNAVVCNANSFEKIISKHFPATSSLIPETQADPCEVAGYHVCGRLDSEHLTKGQK